MAPRRRPLSLALPLAALTFAIAAPPPSISRLRSRTLLVSPGSRVESVRRNIGLERLPRRSALRSVRRQRVARSSEVAAGQLRGDPSVAPRCVEEKAFSYMGDDCQYYLSRGSDPSASPILLIHPVGVGLSKWFWEPFIEEFKRKHPQNDIYAPDLLGCGSCRRYEEELGKGPDTDLAEQWAKQLRSFSEDVIKRPAVVVTQGALGTVGIELAAKPDAQKYVKALILSTPPSWEAVSSEFNPVLRSILWNLLTWPGGNSPLGLAFYKYATGEKFLRDFSTKNLFSTPENVTDDWMQKIQYNAADYDRRFIIFAFLSGFWRRDRRTALQSIKVNIPVMTVFGSSMQTIAAIDEQSDQPTLMKKYIEETPALACSKTLPGKNLLPYETPEEFAEVVGNFVKSVS